MVGYRQLNMKSTLWFFKLTIPGLFFLFIFDIFKTKIQILQQIYVKNVHLSVVQGLEP